MTKPAGTRRKLFSPHALATSSSPTTCELHAPSTTRITDDPSGTSEAGREDPLTPEEKALLDYLVTAALRHHRKEP